MRDLTVESNFRQTSATGEREFSDAYHPIWNIYDCQKTAIVECRGADALYAIGKENTRQTVTAIKCTRTNRFSTRDRNRRQGRRKVSHTVRVVACAEYISQILIVLCSISYKGQRHACQTRAAD